MTAFHGRSAWHAGLIVLTSIATILAGCTTSPKEGRPTAASDVTGSVDTDAGDRKAKPADGDAGTAVWRPASAESGGDECAELQAIPCILQVAEIDVPILGLDRSLHYRSDRVPGRVAAPQADIVGASLGGFTVGEHHAYVPDAQVLLAGDGSRRSVVAIEQDDALFVASQDGRELYEFNPDGVHMRTRNATTGDDIHTFDYDDGHLAAIHTPGEPDLVVDWHSDAIALAIDTHTIVRLTLTDGMLTEAISPLDGKVYRFGYAEGGLLTSMTDPLGTRTTYTYDEEGRLLTSETADGDVSYVREDGEVSVSADGQPVGTLRAPKEPADPWTWTAASGDVVRETASESGDHAIDFGGGFTVEITAADHPLFGPQVTYAATTVMTRPGEPTTTEHRTITAEGPLTAPTEVRRTVGFGAGDTVTVWDAASRTVSSTTPGGRTTRVVLDELGRVQSAGGFGVSEMTIERDADNFPTEMTVDGIAGTLAWADGEVTTSLGGTEQTMHVGRDGSVSSVTDALGRTMSRDTVGNIVTTSLNGETLSIGVGDGQHVTWNFPAGDGATHITSTSDDGRTITSGWDGGRTVRTELDDGLPVRTESGGTVTTFDYDDASGALRSIVRGDVEVAMTESGRGGAWRGLAERTLEIGYETGDDGLASGVTIDDTTFDVRYDPDGLLAQMGPISFERSTGRALVTEQTVGNVVLRRYYDDAARPSGTNIAVGDQTVADVTLHRDDTLRLLGVDLTVGATRESASYDYDAAGRLVGAERGDHRWAYTWDERDNLLEISTDGKSRDINVDAGGRVTRADGLTYSYNADHALAKRSDGLTIATTPTGSVQRVTLPGGGVVEYLLDGMNRRVGRLLDGEVTDYFTYHDALRPAAQYDADGKLAAAFFYDGNGALAAITKPSGTYAVVTDTVGSPVLVIDATTGAVEQQITYDPFGAIIADTNPGFQPFGFVGALADPDTGLVNIGAREYDPALGRFLSADPALADGSPINLYAYGRGNPVELVDRNGRDAAVYAGPPGPTRAQMDEFNAMMDDFMDAVAAAGEAGLAGASAAAGGFSGWADLNDLARRLDLDTFRAGAMASWGKYSPAELVSELKRIRMLRNAALAADLFPVLDVLTGAYGVYSAHQDIMRYGPSNLRAAHLAAALLGLISGILGVLALAGMALLAPELLLLLGMATALLSFCLMITLCASIFGDPHIRTTDGARFDYQGVGEFWAMRSDGGGFDVQLRQEAYTGHVSVVTAAAVRFGDDVVELYGEDRRVVVNGADVEIAVGTAHDFDGGTVTRVDTATYRVVNAAKDSGIEARVGGSLDLTIGISESLAGHVSGLYGNVDGDPDNDWTLPDGTVIDMAGDGAFDRLHRKVGPAWRVKAADMLLDGPSVWDADFPPSRKTAADLPAADRAWAESVCRAAGVNDERFLADCILDVGHTGDPAFAASAVNAAAMAQRSPARAELEFSDGAVAHTTLLEGSRMTDFPVRGDGAGHALVVVGVDGGTEVVAIDTDPGADATGPAGDSIAWRHPTDGHCGVAVGGSGQSTWVAIPSVTGGGDRVILIVDSASGTVSQTITLKHDRGPVCKSIAAAKDQVVVFTSADGPALSGYRADSAKPEFAVAVPDDFYGPVTAGDGSMWAVSVDDGEITTGRIDPSDGALGQTVTLPGSALESAPVATEDGFVVSISGGDGEAVVRVNADGVAWKRDYPVTIDDKEHGAPSRIALDDGFVAGYSTSSFLVVLDARTGDPVGMIEPTSFNNNGGHVTMHDGAVTVAIFGGKHWVEGYDPATQSLAFGLAAPDGPHLSDVKRLDSLGVRGLVVQSSVDDKDLGVQGTAVTIFR